MMNTSVHRLLDEAFAGIPATPDAQDLKEEIRANLLDRVAELTAGGTAPDEAARRAFDELGDVRVLVEEATGSADAGSDGTARTAPSAMELVARNRVPRKPSFVALVVLMSIVLAASVVGTVFAAIGLAHRDVGLGLPVGIALVAGAALGWVVGASLAQETPTNHPMPARRAALFGIGWGLVLVACLLAYVHLSGARHPLWFVVDGLALVAGVVLLSYLAANSTNRKKQWALAEGLGSMEAADRFSRDPAAAARFGIYTVVLWSLTAAVILVVGLTIGWTWVWLPGVLGWALFMLMLATMLFGTKHTQQD